MNQVAHYNSFLPALNAVLNGSSAFLLALGFFYIRTRRPRAHKNTMIAAFLVSSFFLVSYLYYHFNFTAKHFEGSYPARMAYYTMLLTHVVGAIILVPGVITLLCYAAKANWHKHKCWARWVWPLWMYTSITGVVVYICLYGLI